MKKFKVKLQGTGTLQCGSKGCGQRRIFKFNKTINTVTVNMAHIMPELGWTIVTCTHDGTYALCPDHSKRRSF